MRVKITGNDHEPRMPEIGEPWCYWGKSSMVLIRVNDRIGASACDCREVDNDYFYSFSLDGKEVHMNCKDDLFCIVILEPDEHTLKFSPKE